MGVLKAKMLDGSWVAVGGAGSAGVGVPAGGHTGEVLTKTADTDYATAWTSFSVTVSTTAPTSPDVNDIWIDVS